MGVKYRVNYQSIDLVDYQLDISNQAYTGEIIEVRGVGGSCCVINHDIGSDDPYGEALIPSNATINLINQGQIDTEELRMAQDKDFVVELYRSSQLIWKGYILPDNVKTNFKPVPYDIQLTATDGLSLLGDITVSVRNLPAPAGGDSRCPLNWLRSCLFHESNLGIMLPIRWAIDMSSDIGGDPLAGLMTWAGNGDDVYQERYYNENGTEVLVYRNIGYIVEGIVKAFGCRLFQSDGIWWIVKINDIASGVVNYKECPASLGTVTITNGSLDINRDLNTSKVGYSFIREDAVITGKPAVSIVENTYNSSLFTNIIPNGNFNSTALGAIVDWEIVTNPSSRVTMEVYPEPAINGQAGNSMQVTYAIPTSGTYPDGIISHYSRMPIDTNILFKELMSINFTLLPQNGFPYYTSGANQGRIDWGNDTFKIRASFVARYFNGSTYANRVYYLNKFGFWQWVSPLGFLSMSIANVGTNTFTYTFDGTPMFGDVITIRYRTATNQPVQFVYTVPRSLEANISGVIDDIIATWSIMPTGAYVRTRTSVNVLRIQQIASNITENGSSVENSSDGINADGSIGLDAGSARIGDVINFQFRGNGGNNNILMPAMGEVVQSPLNVGLGRFKLEFYIKGGQRYVLDDVNVTVGDNRDIYKVVASGVKGITEKAEMNISSSFSGFVKSNLMRNFPTSNVDMWWKDKYNIQANLTEHYTRMISRGRYRPLRVFNGTVNTRYADWSFVRMFNIEGLSGKFLPIRSSWNTEIAESNIVSVECVDDNIPLTVNHFSSNNNNNQ